VYPVIASAASRFPLQFSAVPSSTLFCTTSFAVLLCFRPVVFSLLAARADARACRCWRCREFYNVHQPHPTPFTLSSRGVAISRLNTLNFNIVFLVDPGILIMACFQRAITSRVVTIGTCTIVDNIIMFYLLKKA